MLCDTSCFDELFGIELHNYRCAHSEELGAYVAVALRDGCQGIVGGDICCAAARQMDLPCRFIPSGEESMRNALEEATRVAYAIDTEKHNSAEMDTMLNYTFNGIMQIDGKGMIQRVNRACYGLLKQNPGGVIGRPVGEVLPALNHKVLEDTLYHGKETYAFVMDIRSKAVIVNAAPIRVDGEIAGAILTFQEGQRIIEMDSELRRELYQRGYVAKRTFENDVCQNKESLANVALAQRIAKLSAPILLSGPTGTGKDQMAQCIHNASLNRNNAFVSLDCSAWLPETLDNMLFGNYTTRKDSPACLAELAQEGTLYLSNVEDLPMETQYKLLNLIRGKFLHNGSNRPSTANVRVIASTSANLIARVDREEFRNDLYYALNVLSIDLAPLRRRREDILPYVDAYLDEWQERYKRYVHLTQGARQYMQEYDWPGNLDQVNSVCERIVLLTERRNVDEVFVRRQLEQVAPKMLAETETVVLFKDQKAAEIAQLLRKHNGNRAQVAEELGVSKTTLWRYIKKYGIAADYSY
jgi:transcriptional regulator with PAS, ATPase and Fis domain